VCNFGKGRCKICVNNSAYLIRFLPLYVTVKKGTSEKLNVNITTSEEKDKGIVKQGSR